jgi:protein-S-isoprenylcysteine O-methyltransferase Ste14
VRLVPGLVLFVVGVGIAVSAVWAIWRAGSSVVPVRPTTALVTGGVFRLTRNPMYLGLALGYAGVSVSLNAIWPLLVLPFVVRAVRRRVIGREEAYLERKFGRTYRRYVERVPRWI